MTEERMALIELVEKKADGDLVREMLAFAAERIWDDYLRPRCNSRCRQSAKFERFLMPGCRYNTL